MANSAWNKGLLFGAAGGIALFVGVLAFVPGARSQFDAMLNAWLPAPAG